MVLRLMVSLHLSHFLLVVNFQHSEAYFFPFVFGEKESLSTVHLNNSGVLYKIPPLLNVIFRQGRWGKKLFEFSVAVLDIIPSFDVQNLATILDLCCRKNEYCTKDVVNQVGRCRGRSTGTERGHLGMRWKIGLSLAPWASSPGPCRMWWNWKIFELWWLVGIVRISKLFDVREGRWKVTRFYAAINCTYFAEKRVGVSSRTVWLELQGWVDS